MTSAEAAAIVSAARADASADKPDMRDMIEALQSEASAVESFEARKLEQAHQIAPSPSNIRKIVVLDAAIRFLERIEKNKAAVARVLRG